MPTVDNSARIAKINEILESGVSQMNIEGVVTIVNHDSLREERRRLIAEDTVLRRKRRLFRGVDLTQS